MLQIVSRSMIFYCQIKECGNGVDPRKFKKESFESGELYGPRRS